MSIKDLFRQRADTTSDLQAKFKAISEQKNSLEKEIELLRSQILNSDDPGLSRKLDDLKEEIALSSVAMAEVKKQMEAMISKKVESDYKGLDAEKTKFDKELFDLYRQTGENLGRTVRDLQASGLSPANMVSKGVREVLVEIGENPHLKGQLDTFLKAYSSEIEAETDTVNFKHFKKRLLAIEKYPPGSIETERYVKNQARDLLHQN